jgi:hypothetical protein
MSQDVQPRTDGPRKTSGHGNAEPLTPVLAFPVERLACSTDGALDCGFRAVQNLYAWAELEPPPLADLFEWWSLYGVRASGRTLAEVLRAGLKAQEQAALLEAFGFPSCCALGLIPENLTARDVFPLLNAAGYGVLFNYRARMDGRGLNHSVVLLSCDAEGMEVLDAVPHYFYGFALPAFDLDAQQAARIQAFVASQQESGEQPVHGTITRLPFDTISYAEELATPVAAFENFSELPAPVGIHRLFVMTFPFERKAVA